MEGMIMGLIIVGFYFFGIFIGWKLKSAVIKDALHESKDDKNVKGKINE